MASTSTHLPQSAFTWHRTRSSIAGQWLQSSPAPDVYVAWDSLSLATSRYSINLARSEEGGLFGPVTTVVSSSLVSSPALAVNKSRVHIGWDNWGFNSVPPYKTVGSLMMTSSPNGAQLTFATPLEIAGTGIGFSQRIPAMPEKGVKPNLNLVVDPNDDSHIWRSCPPRSLSRQTLHRGSMGLLIPASIATSTWTGARS